jgi:hypothetical protein
MLAREFAPEIGWIGTILRFDLRALLWLRVPAPVGAPTDAQRGRVA